MPPAAAEPASTAASLGHRGSRPTGVANGAKAAAPTAGEPTALSPSPSRSPGFVGQAFSAELDGTDRRLTRGVTHGPRCMTHVVDDPAQIATPITAVPPAALEPPAAAESALAEAPPAEASAAEAAPRETCGSSLEASLVPGSHVEVAVLPGLPAAPPAAAASVDEDAEWVGFEWVGFAEVQPGRAWLS